MAGGTVWAGKVEAEKVAADAESKASVNCSLIGFVLRKSIDSNFAALDCRIHPSVVRHTDWDFGYHLDGQAGSKVPSPPKMLRTSAIPLNPSLEMPRKCENSRVVLLTCQPAAIQRK
jgi:hypothetical protein